MENKPKISWTDGGAMIATAGIFDLIIATIGLLNLSGVGFAVVVMVAWIPSLIAYLTFALWLAIKSSFSLKTALLLVAPFTSGCVGVPGWTATIWPLMAKTIAADKLGAIAPAAGKIAQKLSK